MPRVRISGGVHVVFALAYGWILWLSYLQAALLISQLISGMVSEAENLGNSHTA